MNIGGQLAKGIGQLSTASPGIMANLSGGFKLPTDKQIAERLGMGQYKPGEVGFDETPFQDTTRSNAQLKELSQQREKAKGRTFEGAIGAQLDPASTMQAAQLADAERVAGAQIATDPQAQFRQGQQDLVSALQAQAAGQGPSLAAMQMDDARQQNIATAMALGASQRGLTAGQGLRSIADQTQAANQAAARDAMRGRIAEQLAAREQLGGVLSGARAQDIGLATSQAGLEQQAALSNQAAANQFALQQAAMEQDAAAANQGAINQLALQQGALDQQTALANQQAGLQAQAQQDALIQALNQQMGGIAQTQDQRLMDLERIKLGRDLGLEQMRAGGYTSRQSAIQNFLAGLAGAGAKVAAGG